MDGRMDIWRTDGRMSGGRTDGFQKIFSALFKSYPRFIQMDKTRMWSKKHFSAFFESYPRVYKGISICIKNIEYCPRIRTNKYKYSTSS
jgi:hypothetical protein